MQIVHIIPGSGGSFYCQNCIKDTALVKELRSRGHDVVVIPMYLPSFPDDPELARETPTFFGAINVYLKQKFRLWEKMPRWIQHMVDHPLLLKYVGKFAGSTEAGGLEDMTLSMLRGSHGNQRQELQMLIEWMKHDLKPDVVHLSNALMSGLAEEIKKQLDLPIVCSLQDEDHWIDSMAPEFQKQTWALIKQNAQYIDRFIAVSCYFAHEVGCATSLDTSTMDIVYPGLQVESYTTSILPSPPVIGYLYRTAEGLGLDRLVDAFLLLKQIPQFKTLRLAICGGMTNTDTTFISSIKKKIKKARVEGDVTFIEGINHEVRSKFLSELSVLSVPTDGGDAIGTYLLEAFAAGVPVVQPRIGGFIEVVETSNAGIVYEPNDAETLSQTLEEILTDREKLEAYASAAKKAAKTIFNIETMADKTEQIYTEVINDN